MNTAAGIANETLAPQPSVWEAAYLRFETPEQEHRKFCKRLIQLGARRWPQSSQIVELFCGRGNGLHALNALGFQNIEGIDLSPHLASCHRGPGTVRVGDCRELPYPDRSRDILIVQGGLHHLPSLPDDLERSLFEVARVLRPGGRFVAVEPWLTTFLRFVHGACQSSMARGISGKLDALATMIEHERSTYDQWLNNPEIVLQLLQTHFDVELQTMRWGKLNFVGRKR